MSPIPIQAQPSPEAGPRPAEEATIAALEALYRAFFLRLVRRAVWRYGLSKEDAREVVHDAFVLALVKMSAEGNPRAWLYSVVDRLAANWKRKVIRRSRLLEKWEPGAATGDYCSGSGDGEQSWSSVDPEGGES